MNFQKKNVFFALTLIIILISIFGCSKNGSSSNTNQTNDRIYWYLTDNNTVLHLSGTEPDNKNYKKGNNDFNTQKKNGKTDFYIEAKDGKALLYKKNNVDGEKMSPRVFFNTPIYDAKKIIIDNIISTKYINFSYMDNVEEIENINYIDTTKMTSMSMMFAYCTSLKNVDLSRFDTINATSMNSMFSNCESLTNVDVSCFNTSNVEDMFSMFAGCKNLTSLMLNCFDTSKVKTMQSMFSKCENLVQLDLSSFDTSNVTNMSYMFANCKTLKNIDILNFHTKNVNTFDGMFSRCSNLEKIDLSNFNVLQDADIGIMFNECINLKTIFASEDFYKKSESNTRNVFLDDKCLVGGNGTCYNDYYMDMAVIDSNSKKGYLTYKSPNWSLVKGYGTVELGDDGYYYLNNDKCINMWIFYNGHKYYLDSEGKTVTNRWVDNHYLGDDGIMYTNRSTPDGKQVDLSGNIIDIDNDLNSTLQSKSNKPDTWYVTNSGIWYFFENDRTTKKKGWYVDPQDKQTYYLYPDTGMMATGWVEIDGNKYYFSEKHSANPNWYYLEYSDTWKSKGDSVKSYGSMYRNETTPDGNYVDADGVLSGTSKVNTTSKTQNTNSTASINGLENISNVKCVKEYALNSTYDKMNTVTFGSYPQSSAGSKDPLEWLVLTKESDKALLLSKYVIDCKPYNETITEVTWNNCTLNKWLNSNFKNEAFGDEKSKIKAVLVPSISDMNNYFNDVEGRKAIATKYAKDNGCWVSSQYSINGDGTVCYFLSDNGDTKDKAAFVGDTGGIGDWGSRVNLEDCGIRPAIWVKYKD